MAKLPEGDETYGLALLAYARRYEEGKVENRTRHCPTCGWNYLLGDGGSADCRRCYPTQPPSFEAVLQDPEANPGRSFFWDELSWRWRAISSFTLFEKSFMSDLWEVIRPYRPDRATTFFGTLKRMAAMIENGDSPHRDRAQTEAKRACELADRLSETERVLERKRIECDELRDRIAALGGS